MSEDSAAGEAAPKAEPETVSAWAVLGGPSPQKDASPSDWYDWAHDRYWAYKALLLEPSYGRRELALIQEGMEGYQRTLDYMERRQDEVERRVDRERDLAAAEAHRRAMERQSRSLPLATWVLAGATVALIVATFVGAFA